MTNNNEWDQNRYRVWFFAACTSLNYLDEMRNGLLPTGMTSQNTDIFGTNNSIPIAGGIAPITGLLEGILHAETMEQIVVRIQRSSDENIRRVLGADADSALRDNHNAYFVDGAGDNMRAGTSDSAPIRLPGH
jgi:hypothetical protein